MIQLLTLSVFAEDILGVRFASYVHFCVRSSAFSTCLGGLMWTTAWGCCSLLSSSPVQGWSIMWRNSSVNILSIGLKIHLIIVWFSVCLYCLHIVQLTFCIVYSLKNLQANSTNRWISCPEWGACEGTVGSGWPLSQVWGGHLDSNSRLA